MVLSSFENPLLGSNGITFFLSLNPKKRVFEYKTRLSTSQSFIWSGWITIYIYRSNFGPTILAADLRSSIFERFSKIKIEKNIIFSRSGAVDCPARRWLHCRRCPNHRQRRRCLFPRRPSSSQTRRPCTESNLRSFYSEQKWEFFFLDAITVRQKAVPTFYQHWGSFVEHTSPI